MPVNPYGAVQAGDFGQPKILTFFARETISGGQFVTGSTAAGVVSSGLDSFIDTDLKCSLAGSGTTVTGIALKTVTSGLAIPIAVEGVFILPVRATLAAGQNCSSAGDDAVGVQAADGQIIGRALTEGASGGFVVAHLRF